MASKVERLDLNRVAIFLKVAEAKGITAAATRAKLPKSTVSRSLSQLEDELGVELVLRRTKEFQLTDAGQEFYDAASRGIGAVSDARDRLRKDSGVPTGKLRVAAPPGIASYVIMPAITAFVRAYPEVEIELCVTAAAVEPVRDGFDVVLATGPLDDSSAKVRRLGVAGAGVFGSTRYLAERGIPRRPSDLPRHDCILHSRARKATRWRLAGPSGTTEVAVRGRIMVDDIFSAMAAALNDGGLVVLPTHLVGADPAARTLQRVLPDHEVRGEPTQLVYAASRHTPRRVTMFCDALMSHMKGNCPSG